MSYPLLYRGVHIVLTMAGALHYHVGSPFTTGYDSLKSAYAAIDALIDNQGEEHEATAATALPAGH